MKLIVIKDRACIVLTGIDCKVFLQNVITADMKNLSENSAIWAMVLSPQGKIQYGFFVFEKNAKIYLDVQKDKSLAGLNQYLEKYLVNMDVEFSIIKNVEVMATLKGEIVSDKIIKNPNVIIIDDTRSFDKNLNVLGKRIYIFDKTLKIKPTNSFAKYEMIRIEKCIIDFDVDINQGQDYPIAVLADKLGGLDYNKGCFIGQEVAARMHYRGKVKRKIALVKIIDKTALKDNQILYEGRVVAKITSSTGELALGMMEVEYINRLDNVDANGENIETVVLVKTA